MQPVKKTVKIVGQNGSKIEIADNGDLVLVAGPCAIESYDHSMKMAEQISKVCDKYKTKLPWS